MKRVGLLMFVLLCASLACTLTSSDDEESQIRTPTPIRISDTEATATRQAVSTQRPTIASTAQNGTPTPLPTLFSTPTQFSAAQSNPPTPTPLTASGSVVTGSSEVAASSGSASISLTSGAAAGAPQNNGFYYPNTIVYNSGGVVRAVTRDGASNRELAVSNAAQRSLNGLFVALGRDVVRPDGQDLGTFSNLSAGPTWNRDGTTAYFGSSSTLMKYEGSAAAVDQVNGELTTVQFGPDGSTLMYASRSQIKIILGDGSRKIAWEDSNSSITRGPFWAYRDEELGIYVELSDGRRAFIGSGFSVINDPAERLQLQSPANPYARVYVRDGTTLVGAWPGQPEVEFQAGSLRDVSWSPDGAELVYANLNGELAILDLSTGNTRIIARNTARNPQWTMPVYIVHH